MCTLIHHIFPIPITQTLALAAVDAHVGKALFNKCIVDELLLGKSKSKDEVGASPGWKGRRKEPGLSSQVCPCV